MVTRNVEFVPGEFYHVYNRGTDKREIFNSETDYERFQQLMYLSNSSQSINVRDIKKDYDMVYDFERSSIQVAIGAYCLMPNHFHILLSPLIERGVQTFMQKITTSYSMYYNRRHDRSGNLFQGRYKAQYVDSDEYLKYLYAYIHLNPLKLYQSNWREEGVDDSVRAVECVCNYQYSSLSDYVHNHRRNEQAILNVDSFPPYFQQAEDHLFELFDWVETEES